MYKTKVTSEEKIKELRPTGGNRSEIYMTRGRKTTHAERIEIVASSIPALHT